MSHPIHNPRITDRYPTKMHDGMRRIACLCLSRHAMRSMLCEGYHAYAYPLDVTCHASVMHLSDDLHLIYRCATGQMHVSDYLHLMHEVQVSHDLHHMHICQMPCIRWISVRCYITRIHIRWLSSAIRVSDHSHVPYLCWVTLICHTSFAIHHLPYMICHT